MRVIIFLTALICVTGNCYGESTGKDLAINYINDVVHQRYENIEKYIDTSSFTDYPQVIFLQASKTMVEKGIVTADEADGFKAALLEGGFSEKEISELTVSDVLIEFYIQMYELVNQRMITAKIDSITFISSHKESNNREHFLFKIHQTSENDEVPSLNGYQMEDIEVVTVNYIDGIPHILPPAMVEYYVRMVAGFLSSTKSSP